MKNLAAILGLLVCMQFLGAGSCDETARKPGIGARVHKHHGHKHRCKAAKNGLNMDKQPGAPVEPSAGTEGDDSIQATSWSISRAQAVTGVVMAGGALYHVPAMARSLTVAGRTAAAAAGVGLPLGPAGTGMGMIPLSKAIINLWQPALWYVATAIALPLAAYYGYTYLTAAPQENANGV